MTYPEWKLAFRNHWPNLQARHFYWERVKEMYKMGLGLDRAIREYAKHG